LYAGQGERVGEQGRKNTQKRECGSAKTHTQPTDTPSSRPTPNQLTHLILESLLLLRLKLLLLLLRLKLPVLLLLPVWSGDSCGEALLIPA
jgi:hypothetical protein